MKRDERLYTAIQEQIVSEKSSLVASKYGTVVLRVSDFASKCDIADAIERLFGVKPISVRTLRVSGKVKRGRGKRLGRCSNWKKAYVSLPKGSSMDLLASVTGYLEGE